MAGGRDTGGDVWRDLVVASFLRPRDAARRVMRARIGFGALIEAGLAVCCIGVVLAYVSALVAGGPGDPVVAFLLDRPIVGAASQAVALAVAIGLTWKIGQLFGGTGGLGATILLLVWLNAVALLPQLALIVLVAASPPLGTLFALAIYAWMLWAYANFVTELHGFDSPVMVLGVSILTCVALMFGLTMLAAILGFGGRGGA
jgi:hypothetical protein